MVQKRKQSGHARRDEVCFNAEDAKMLRHNEYQPLTTHKKPLVGTPLKVKEQIKLQARTATALLHPALPIPLDVKVKQAGYPEADIPTNNPL